ncbi:amidohydrolase [Novosphingobium sp. PC22D]|uniref:amidohydrolase family protein n=1 Tax=Novosphingobium sp. PC22D TaxID=1962403 RepID=UPI000BF165C1|nr:amidohydrolase family protein [Novosphingobium sp. PC22D]PEQ13959.1 amidohydrolase [Novosphingobium sp. PC22D]
MVTFTNARVFDGTALLPGTRTVAIDGDRIASVSEEPGGADAIDLSGMTLMPGLITCHFHPDFYKFTLAMGMAGEPLGKELPPGVLMAIAIRNAGVLLESGFTGYVGAACSNDIDASLKMAIEQGIMTGPRIRACSQHIGTTGDVNDSKAWWRRFDSPGTDVFVDGPDAMRSTVREFVRRGAETIKIFTTSGHAGLPWPVERTMERDEIEAVVTAAHGRGAMVRAHVATRAMIRECVEIGVDIIDHGDGIDEEIIVLMAERGTFWVPSMVYPSCMIGLGWAGPEEAAAQENVAKMLPIAQAAGVRILTGDDYSGVFREVIEDDPLDHKVGDYGREFAFYQERTGLPAEVLLSWGTKNAAQALTGGRDTLGVIEPGALADIAIFEGDPLADLSILSRPAETLRAVMRDGALVIDRLDRPSQHMREAAE